MVTGSCPGVRIRGLARGSPGDQSDQSRNKVRRFGEG